MRDADPEVLKAAYLALVKKYHPDRTGNDPTRTKRFLEIRAAWELLTDQQGRAFYDQQSAAEAAATKSQSSNSDLNRNEPRQTAGSFTKSKPSIFERLQYGAAASLVFGVGGFVGVLILLLVGIFAVDGFRQSSSGNGLTKETNDFLRELAKKPTSR